MDGGANTGYRELLQVVADPSRWRILALLSAGPRTVGELVAELDVGQPSVSHHLGRLRKAGLVEAVVDGRCRRYGWPEIVEEPARAEFHGALRRWITDGVPVPRDDRRRPAQITPIDVHLL